MSSKIEGIFPHDLTSCEDVEELPARLRPIFRTLAPPYRSYWTPSPETSPFADPAWHIGLWSPPRDISPRQQWDAGRGPMLFGPGKTPVDPGLWLVLGRRCLFVTTGIKWWFAMDHPSLLSEVRSFFCELAAALSSPAFILHRDNGCLSWDWVSEGMTFDQIEGELAKEGARRVTSLEALRCSQSKVEEMSYYRERVETDPKSATSAAPESRP